MSEYIYATDEHKGHWLTGEEIVRCRDCRHFKKGEEEQPIDWCCYFHDEVTPDGFCAWGEKVVSE